MPEEEEVVTPSARHQLGVVGVGCAAVVGLPLALLVTWNGGAVVALTMIVAWIAVASTPGLLAPMESDDRDEEHPSRVRWFSLGPVLGAALVLLLIADVVLWDGNLIVAAIILVGGVLVFGYLSLAARDDVSQEAGIPTRRERVPAGMRFDVFHRDGFRCRYCGRSSTEDGVQLHADHVVPVSKGGPTTMDNLVTACQDCNLGKSAKDVV